MTDTELIARVASVLDSGGDGAAPAGYDMKSIHAGAWGGEDGYLYSKDQVIADLGDWLESR